MKALVTFQLMIFLSLLLTGCVIVDDDCYYETKCSYICDPYGNNCVIDWCRDELICDVY